MSRFTPNGSSRPRVLTGALERAMLFVSGINLEAGRRNELP
jgi:hypothetical protein